MKKTILANVVAHDGAEIVDVPCFREHGARRVDDRKGAVPEQITTEISVLIFAGTDDGAEVIDSESLRVRVARAVDGGEGLSACGNREGQGAQGGRERHGQMREPVSVRFGSPDVVVHRILLCKAVVNRFVS